jgi:hypothetical protein
MSISTSKSILITPGSFSSSNNAISQIDLKWVESGVGTFVFRPNVNDLRSTIYNWQQNSEPVILFGGMGTVNGVRKFAGPYQDYTGTFSGITSFPQIQFFPLSGTIYANTLTLSGIASFNQIYSAGLSTFGSINLLGPLYDQTFNSGSVNQVLTSTVNGVAWSTPSTYGNISGLGITNYVSKFSNSTSLTTSNIIDNGSLVTVGIGMSVNGFTTVAGSFVSTGNAGIGTNINSNVRLVTRSADSTSATESFRAVDSSGTASLQINGAGFVGIGSLSAIYRLNVFHNTTNANIGAYQANLEVTQTAATARSILGGRFSVTGRINATSTNNIYGIYGVIGFSYASAGVTNSGEVAAGAFDARISNANHSGTNAMQMAVFGMYNASASATGLGTIQNAYGGRFIADYGFPANFTIQNSFGVRVQSTNSTSYPQNSFGFYEDLASAANAKNFFLNPVGIGTSSPTQNLHVQGNARLTGGLYDSTNSQGSLSQILSSTGSGIAWTSFNSSGIFTGTVAPNQVAIGSTGNRLQGFSTFIFDSTGLSIGTSIPEQRLTVSGNVKATGTITANQFISTTFTDPPLVVNSQSLVTNLNSEYWKDQAYPLSTIGDLLYSSDNSGTAARLAPNTTTVIKVLTQVGDGVEASAPSWQPLPSSGFLQYFFTGLAATNAPQNYQLANDLPVGLGTTSINFTSGEALVAQFITDPGVPNLEFLPAGNLTAYVWGLQTISTTIAAVPTVQLRVDFYETTSLGTSIAKIASSNDSTELVPTAERYTLIGITTGTYNLASRSSRIQARVYAVHGLTGIATINVFYGNGYDSLVQIVAPGADVTNFVPYQGAVNNVDLGIKNLRAGAVGLYTGFSTVAPEQGQFIWNSTTQEVDLGLSDGYSVSVGFENALRVYNNTLNTIGVGSVVYVTGAAGNIPTVDLASASLFDSSTVVGVTNRFIAPASYGYIYTYGTIDYNTSSFVSGDNLFLSDTQAGILTSISPLAPSFSVLVGTVLNSGTSGSIVVLQNSINSLNESSRILFANSNKFPQGISTFVYSRGNVGIGTTAPTQNLHVQGNARLTGGLYDNANSPGSLGQILSSTGSGIAWTSVNTTGILTANGGISNRVTKFLDEDTLGNSNITDTGTLITLGSGVTVSGILTSFGYYGPGTFITNLNASNLASGTVPSSVVSGSYSGITSVGSLTQLNVTGITTSNIFVGNGSNITNLNASNLTSGIVNANRISGSYSGITSVGTLTQLNVAGITTSTSIRISNQLYDSNFSSGTQNQLLVSTGVGISWTSSQATGIITGTGAATRLAYFADANTLTSNSNFIIDSFGQFGISTTIPRNRLDVYATARFSGQVIFYGSTSNDAFGLTQQFDSTYQGTNNVLRFRQGGSTAGAVAFSFYDFLPNIFMTLDGSSLPRVGIGTTGPLQTLHVGGNALISGLTTSTGFFGPGTNITNLNASNLIFGTVPSVVVSGTYSGITSVGTLSQLNVSGITTSTVFVGNGSNITNLNASNLASGIVPSSTISGSYSGITSVGNLTQLNVTGITTLQNLELNGWLLDANNSSGSLGQILSSTGTGVAWTSVNTTGILTATGGISNRVSKFLDEDTLGNSNITDTGTLITLGSAVSVSGILTSFGFFGPGTNLTNLNASNLTSGTVPSAVVSGAYSGITSVGTLSQLNVSGTGSMTNLFVSGQFGVSTASVRGANIDLNNDVRISGALDLYGGIANTTQSLVFRYDSTYSGVTDVLRFRGTNVAANAYAFTIFDRPPNLWMTSVGALPRVGIGKTSPTTTLDVEGTITATGFSGPGTNLTNLNASNLASGTVPSAVVSGVYSGITSVGTLTQLNVSGITTVTNLQLSGWLRDSSSSIGSTGQILSSTGTGIAWTTVSSTGILTGNGIQNVVAKFNSSSSLTTSNISDNGIAVTVGSQIFVNGIGSFTGDITVNSITIGLGSGQITTNTVVGNSALTSNTTGSNNVSVGRLTLNSNVTGAQNVAIGAEALRYYTTVSNQVAIGYQALAGSATSSFNTGTQNTAIGHQAGLANTSGTDNTFIGYQAGVANTSGYQNSIFGSFAFAGNLTGFQNTAFGYLALRNNISGNTNVAVGRQSLYSNTSGGNNVAIGNNSMFWSVSGNNNTFVGGLSGFYQSGQSSQTAVGYNALAGNSDTTLNTGQLNTAFGFNAGAANTSGSFNVFVGYNAGVANTSGSSNSFFGYFAGSNNLTANNNTFVGSTAGTNTRSGSGNVAMGISALNQNTSGTHNVAIGRQSAYYSVTASDLVAVGNNALFYYTGSGSNTAVGSGALFGNATTALNTGTENTAVGQSAGLANTAGTQNVFVGHTAGNNNTTGSQNTYLGHSAGLSNITDNYQIAVGFGVSPVGSNRGAIGRNANASRTDIGIGTYAPLSRVHIETLAAGNMGLYIAGSASQTGDLVEINATTFGQNYFTITGVGSVGIYTNTPSQALDVNGNIRIRNGLLDSNNSLGINNQVLISTGTGIAWTTVSSTGILTGAGTVNTISKFNSPNSLTNSNITDNGIAVTVGSQIFVNGIGSFAGDITVNSITVGLGSGQITTNTVVGNSALTSNTTGSNNVSVGRLTLNSNVTGAQNVAIGAEALRYYSTVSNQVAVGYQALRGNTTSALNTGSQNVAVGYQAGLANSSGNFNTFVGHLTGTANTSGSSNSAFGRASLTANTTGDFNTAIGANALTANISGGANIAVGSGALGSNTSGSNNVSSGNNSLNSNTTGGQNVALGHEALRYYSTASNQTAIGYRALRGSTDTTVNTGTQNLAIGYQAGVANTSGSNNTYIGLQAGFGNTSGNNNTIIGSSSGPTLTSGGNNTLLGTFTDASSGGNYQIAIGQGVIPTGSNLGAWGGNTNATRTDLGVGTFTPLGRIHIETLTAGNMGLYIAGSASQTGDLVEVNATTYGQNYFTITGIGSVGIYTNTPSQALDVNGGTRLRGRLFDNNNTAGSLNQVLISTGSGIAWTTSTSTGIVTGTGSANQVTYWNSTNQITGSNAFVFNGVGSVGIGTSSPEYALHVVGTLAATIKSFIIEHPTVPGKKLRYASLEGPENGVYLRGRTNETKIILPEYWRGLVDHDSITVNITPIGTFSKFCVEKIENYIVYVKNKNIFAKNQEYFYTVFGERKDVDKLQVEI